VVALRIFKANSLQENLQNLLCIVYLNMKVRH